MTILPNGDDTIAAMPAITDQGANDKAWFADPDPAQGIAGTKLNAAYMNKQLLLLRTLFTAAGVVDTTAKASTLLDAIRAIAAEIVEFTGDQPMGGYKLTGLGVGSAAGHSINWEQLQAVITSIGEIPTSANDFTNLLKAKQDAIEADADVNPAISDSVITIDSAIVASLTAVKVAFDKGAEALTKANTKSDAGHTHASETDNNYTTIEKNKLSGIATGAEANRSISDSVTSASTTTNASSKAVKTAYDKGNSALTAANGAVQSVRLGTATEYTVPSGYEWMGAPSGSVMVDRYGVNANTHSKFKTKLLQNQFLIV